METGLQTHSDIRPEKETEYESYILWKALPAFFKYPPVAKDGSRPDAVLFCESLGVDDDRVLQLVKIKTQKEFAERFDVSEDTLSLWNKTIRVRSALQDMREWGRGLTKNVMMSLYNNCIRKGFAIDVKLWLQAVEGWEEKQRIEHEYLGVTKVDIIQVNERPTDGNKDTVGTDLAPSGSVEVPTGQSNG